MTYIYIYVYTYMCNEMILIKRDFIDKNMHLSAIFLIDFTKMEEEFWVDTDVCILIKKFIQFC